MRRHFAYDTRKRRVQCPQKEVPVISKTLLLALALSFPAYARPQQSREPFDTSDPLDENPTTGIEVGARIPPFRAFDPEGKAWDFDSIKGPKGAVLHFYRSADW
jgi:hypothetical protein